MIYRRLGKSGLQVSALSYGSWLTFANQCNEHDATTHLKLAYDHGVNFFDNAEVYAQGASEEIMGKALKKLDFGRDTYCISSKAFWGGEKPTQRGLSRKHIRDACHAALKRLQVDYLDLYFCHRPDTNTPIEETVRAMHELILQGKILYWGTSEWSAVEIMQAYAISREFQLTPPTMEQPQYNLFSRERVESEYLRLYSEIGLGTTIWSPLASGVLSGKYSGGIPKDSRANLTGNEWIRKRIESPEGRDKVLKTKALEPIANDLDVSLSQLAIAWCLLNPNVSTVILGASRAAQLEENLGALKAFEKLTPKAIEAIEAVVANKPPAPPVF